MIGGALSKSDAKARRALANTARAVRDDFALYADGDLSKTATGHDYHVWPAAGAAKPVISGGKMTYAAAQGAGYASAELAEPIVKLGCRFTLGPYTTVDGVAALIAWVNDIGPSYDAGNGVPATPFHLTIGATQWQLATFPGGGGGIQYIGSGTFAAPLAADAATVHTVEGWIDYVKGVAIIALPDGSVVKVTDAKIKKMAYYACVEPFRYNAGGTDSMPAFCSWWAEAGDHGLIAEGYEKYEAWKRAEGLLPVATTNFPAVDASYALPAGPTAVPGTDAFVIVPPSGKLLVRLSAFVDITADGLIFLHLYSGVTGYLTECVGTKTAHGGRIMVEKVVTMAPAAIGQGYTFHMRANAASGAATLKLHDGGADAFAATISITPLLA